MSHNAISNALIAGVECRLGCRKSCRFPYIFAHSNSMLNGFSPISTYRPYSSSSEIIDCKSTTFPEYPLPVTRSPSPTIPSSVTTCTNSKCCPPI